MAGFTAWRQDLIERERETCGVSPVEAARQLAAALGRSDAELHASANELGALAADVIEMGPDVAVVPYDTWTAIKQGLGILARDNASLRDRIAAREREKAATEQRAGKAEAAAWRWEKRFRWCLWALAVALSPVLFGLMYWITGVIVG